MSVPGPRLPLAVQTVLYGIWPQRYLHWCRRRFGDQFRLRLPTIGPSVVLADPASIRDVFSLRADQITTNATVLEPFLGPKSLLCVDGASHDRQRRLLARAFRAEAMKGYAETMEEVALNDVASWPIGREFALHPRLQAITLEIILRVAFGVNDAGRLDTLRSRLRRFLRDAGSLLVLNPGFRRELRGRSPWARFQGLRAGVLDALNDELVQRRSAADLHDCTDVLSLMLRSENDDDQLDNEELLDNLLTMVLAGHDTTATALAWTFDLLLHHPVALDRLKEELAEGGRSYLGAVIKESLRLRPVVVDTGRTWAQPARLGGTLYAAGTAVTASMLLAHHRADLYPRPLAFLPDRFLADAPEPLTWIPFGGGVRRCLGAGFATLEMEVLLRTIITHCELRAARSRPDAQKRRAVTLVPRRGARVVLEASRVE